MESSVYKKMYENEDTFWWHKGMRKIASTLLDVNFSKSENGKILDVGCGTGGLFSMLSRYGSVYGIDKSDDAVKFARARSSAYSVEQGSIDQLPYADGTFDVATCFDVLYHRWVEDDQKVLQEVSRVLKPGGLLIIREASYNWLRSQHDVLVWTQHRFALSELQKKLEQSGLTVIKRSHVNFFLFPVVLIKRLLEKVFPEKDPLGSMYQISPWLNGFFYFFLLLESVLVKYINFPFGLSIIYVAKKK